MLRSRPHVWYDNGMTDKPEISLAGRWVTTKELAAYLGFSTKWVARRVAEGMPHARMGSQLRFQITPVEDWLHERDQSTGKATVWWDRRPRG